MVSKRGFTIIGALLAILVIALVSSYLLLILSNQTFLLANMKSEIGLRQGGNNPSPGIRDKLEFTLSWFAKKWDDPPDGADSMCKNGPNDTICELSGLDRILYKFHGE